MSAVRILISISLLSLLLLNIFGFFASFVVQRQMIRKEVRVEKRKHTRPFVFTLKEYEQLCKYEKGEEFRLNGGLYDVVKKEVRNGKIILHAFYDHKETSLIGTLISYFQDENIPVKSKRSAISSFSISEFVFTPNEWQIFLSYSFSPLHLFSSVITSLKLDTLSPPPDFCLA